MIDPIDLTDYRDHMPAMPAWWLDLIADPPAEGSVVVLEVDGTVWRPTRRLVLLAWLRENGLSTLARRVEATVVPRAHFATLLLGEPVRIRVLPLPAPDDTTPKTHVAAGVLGRLGGAQ